MKAPEDRLDHNDFLMAAIKMARPRPIRPPWGDLGKEVWREIWSKPIGAPEEQERELKKGAK